MKKSMTKVRNLKNIKNSVSILKKNKKLRNKQAGAFSDKSEVENLFLDCVDENRKEVLKLFTNSYA